MGKAEKRRQPEKSCPPALARSTALGYDTSEEGRSMTGSGIYYGWLIVATMAVVMFITVGTFFYGFATLVDPLSDEFGWSRAAISGAFSLRTEMGGAEAPIIGYLVDRLGSRLMLLVGIALVGTGFILMSQIQAIWQLYTTVAVIAVGMGATGGAVAYTAIAHWFVKKRGRATAIVTLGGGSGGLMVLALSALIDAYGWRTALLTVGAVQIALCVPLALLVRERPEDMGLLPDGERPAVAEETSPRALDGGAGVAKPKATASIHQQGLTMGQVLRTRPFWILGISMALAGLGSQGLVVHQIAYMKNSVNLSADTAAQIATAMTMVSLLGRLAFGYLADFVDKRKLLAAAYLLMAAGTLVMAQARSAWQLLFYLALFSPGWGASIAVRPVLQAEHFGVRSFAGIQGLLFMLSSVGSVTGPIFVGGVFDATGDYRPAFLLTALAGLLAAPMMMAMRRPVAESAEAVAAKAQP